MLFLLPALAALVLFRLLPMAWAVGTSFQDLSGHFAGLASYRFLAQSIDLPPTVRATAAFVVVSVAVQTLFAYALAVLLTQHLPATGVWRTLIFLPVAVPLAGSAIFWSVAFRPDGLINAALQTAHLPAQPFLSSAGQALPAMIAVVAWIGVGYSMVFLVAGLQDIPEELYEAAAIDGASWWRRALHITLPLTRRPLLFVTVSNTIAACVVFAPVQILTRGGPSGATDFVMWDIYQRAYISQDMPTAMAEVTVLVVIMLAAVTLQFRLLRSERGQ